MLLNFILGNILVPLWLAFFIAIVADFFGFFYLITKKYIPAVSSKEGNNFWLLILLLMIFYSFLSIVMGVGGILLIFGVVLIIYGCLVLVISYLLQKSFVRLVYQVQKFFHKDKHFFFQANLTKQKFSIAKETLWLTLLPVPISYVFMQALEFLKIVDNVRQPTYIALGGMVWFLPASIVTFVIWALRAVGLVGVTRNDIFRFSNSLKSRLTWFAVINWVTFCVYIVSIQPELVYAFSWVLTMFITSVIFIGPMSLITVFFYAKLLESRVRSNVINHLSVKEGLAEKVLIVEVESLAESRKED